MVKRVEINLNVGLRHFIKMAQKKKDGMPFLETFMYVQYIKFMRWGYISLCGGFLSAVYLCESFIKPLSQCEVCVL